MFCSLGGMIVIELTNREVEFLKLIVEDITYAEIADKMYLGSRTIDGYRDDLFKKTKSRSRTGLIRYSVANGIGKIPTPK